MRRIFYTTQFKKDLKRIRKQNKDAAKLKAVIEKIAAGEALDKKHKDHPLRGNYAGVRDCHVLQIGCLSTPSLGMNCASSVLVPIQNCLNSVPRIFQDNQDYDNNQLSVVVPG